MKKYMTIQNAMNIALSLGMSAALVGLLSSCAKDITQDQWQNQKAAQQYSQIQSVAGVYSGTMKSTGTDITKSQVALELKASYNISGSTSCGGVSQLATVQGRITIIGDSSTGVPNASVAIDQGCFNTETNELSATLSIVDRAGMKNVLELSGSIQNGGFSGEIDNRNYPDTKQTLSLAMGSATVQQAVVNALSSAVVGRSQVKTYVYSGDLIDRDKNTWKGELRILSPAATAEQLFLEYFAPVKQVGSTLIIKKVNQTDPSMWLALSFQTNWDTRLGTLFGPRSAQTGSDGSDAMLDCRNSSGSWSCSYILGKLGVFYSGVLNPVKADASSSAAAESTIELSQLEAK